MHSLTNDPDALKREVLRGIHEYTMIPSGARVLLALSGGKDSLTLLHLLAGFREELKMDLAAAHVETDAGCGEGIFEGVLKGVCEGLHVPLHHQSFPILAEAGEKLSCFYCAMRRRASLFSLAVDEGYDTLAFGHHLDDMAETLMMNAIFHGNLSTMTPKVTFFDGALTVIRPLVFIRERRLAAYVLGLGLSTAVCGCPYSTDNVRSVMKKWLHEVDEVKSGVPERLYGGMRSLGERS
jgi:tRNA 2-thiocytidine biosynthesis protein TtcA